MKKLFFAAVIGFSLIATFTVFTAANTHAAGIPVIQTDDDPTTTTATADESTADDAATAGDVSGEKKCEQAAEKKCGDASGHKCSQECQQKCAQAGEKKCCNKESTPSTAK